jgi:hypothetical protein
MTEGGEPNERSMRLFRQVAGGLAIIAIFFFGTLFALDFYSPARANNLVREQHIKLLSDALEKYHQARGSYPLLAEGPVDDLKGELVGGGFIATIPSDPARSSKGPQYRYAGGANTYGLLVTLESQPFLIGARTALTCTVGVHIHGSGAWGDPPACPF